MQRIRVGNAEIVGFDNGSRAQPAKSIYPKVDPDALARFQDRMTEKGELVLGFQCFAVVADGATIIVDTSLGPGKSGNLPGELEKAGIGYEDVTLIVHTHLHGDHTGGDMDGSDPPRPAFPNARYYVPRADYDFFREHRRLRESVARDIEPLESLGVLELFEGERSLSQSLTIFPTPGHTPGHSSVAISSDGERGYILGDAIVTTIEVDEPAWANYADWNADVVGQTRPKLLDRLVDEGAIVGVTHFAPPGLGRFVKVEGRRMWQGI